MDHYMDHYILEGHKTVPADLMTWAKWFETAERHVADTTKDGVRVSTVFLGLNHQLGEGPPMLFETMVFGGPLDEEQDHCSTWEEAEAMHARMVERVKQEGSNACLAAEKPPITPEK